LNPRLKDAIGGGRAAVYRNGFIEGLTLSPAEFLRGAPRLFARTPLTTVRFMRNHRDQSRMDELFASPHLRRLRSVEFHFPEDTLPVEKLIDCPYLTNLRTLGFTHRQLGVEEVRALAASTLLTQFLHLDLTQCRIGDEGAAALAAADLSRLERLILAGNHLSAPGVGALAASPHLSRLRELDLGGSRPGEAGVRALATSPALAGLERLSLRSTAVGPEGAGAFTAGNGSGRLRHLVLADPFWQSPPLGDAGATSLAAAPYLSNLRALHLGNQQIGAAGLRAIAGSARLSQLHTLGLGFNPVGNDGARALAASPHLAGVWSLRMRDARINSVGAKALAASPHLGALGLLDLRGNPIRAAGLRALRERFGEALRLTEPEA
jgi:hypothetical protein